MGMDSSACHANEYAYTCWHIACAHNVLAYSLHRGYLVSVYPGLYSLCAVSEPMLARDRHPTFEGYNSIRRQITRLLLSRV